MVSLPDGARLLRAAPLHPVVDERHDDDRGNRQPQDFRRAVAIVGRQAEETLDEVHGLLLGGYAAAMCRTFALASAALSSAMSFLTIASNLATSLSTLAMTSRETAV